MKSLKPRDRDGVIVLLLIIVICVLVFPFIDGWVGADGDDSDNSWSKEKKEKKWKKEGKDSVMYYAVPEKEIALFDFDPNTADSTQLLRLGLRPWQVRNIYKYRAAGGRYRKPTDFARLYGLTLEMYKRLEPHIKIKPEVMAADVYGKNSSYSADDREVIPQQKHYETHKIKKGEHVNINTADTTELKTIPGIGSYYARQIVWKRNRLGGFVDLSQLKEIEGFPESSFEYMEIGSSGSIGKTASKQEKGEITKIMINRADIGTMAKHPYITYAQAKDIANLRRLRGDIHSINELRRLRSFSQEELSRIAPYLDFE